MDDNLAQIDVVHGELSKAREDAAGKAAKRPQFRLGDCRLTEAAAFRLETLLESSKYSRVRIEDRCEALAKEQGPPPEPWIRMLKRIPLPTPPAPAARPEWLGLVCQNRNMFARSAMRWAGDDGEWRCEKFIFALENPIHHRLRSPAHHWGRGCACPLRWCPR